MNFNPSHRDNSMQKNIVVLLLVGSLLSSCGLGFGRRAFGGGTPSNGVIATAAAPTEFPTEPPTHTPVPSPTIAPTPTPDLSLAGLPAESAGTTAFDFAAEICAAQWSNNSQSVPCNDSPSTAGYVMLLPGDIQGLPPSFSVLLTFPPQDKASDTLFGKYPPLAVQKGDRFRSVLACRANTSCDVQFALNYYSGTARIGLKHWSYLFADAPVVVDYPLDGIAGLAVQFELAVQGNGTRIQDYAIWIMPHIYRP